MRCSSIPNQHQPLLVVIRRSEHANISYQSLVFYHAVSFHNILIEAEAGYAASSSEANSGMMPLAIAPWTVTGAHESCLRNLIFHFPSQSCCACLFTHGARWALCVSRYTRSMYTSASQQSALILSNRLHALGDRRIIFFLLSHGAASDTW